MLHQALCRVRDLYADEGKAKNQRGGGHSRCAGAVAAGAGPQKGQDEIVGKTLLHRNGQGVAFDFVARCCRAGQDQCHRLAGAGAGRYASDPRSAAAAPLFDLCILLTDRTELRQNVADEAARLRATQSIAAEAETFKDPLWPAKRRAGGGGEYPEVSSIQRLHCCRPYVVKNAGR